MDSGDLGGDELFKKIEEEIKKGRYVVAQIAPALRVSIGEEFGMDAGMDSTGKLASLLKRLGFSEVLETPFGADLVVYLEFREFIKLIEENDTSKFPLFNSCCVGWREYAEKKHPELVPNISAAVSPMMAVGATAKMFFSSAWKKKPEDVIVVGIMPCTLKKHETAYKMPNGLRYVDYVVTTRELGEWARKKGLDLKKMPEGTLSSLSLASKDGVIFGVTGGVTESLLTTLANHFGEEKKITETRKNESIRKITAKIGKHEIRAAVVYGYPALENFLKNMKKERKQYHFVEVMTCLYGCVGGPGQPLQKTADTIKIRGEALRKVADQKREKTPLESQSIKSLEQKFFSKIGMEELFRLYSFPKK